MRCWMLWIARAGAVCGWQVIGDPRCHPRSESLREQGDSSARAVGRRPNAVDRRLRRRSRRSPGRGDAGDEEVDGYAVRAGFRMIL